MQETWKRFVYPLIEDKKQDVEEETYHRHIENQLMLLGWEPWKGEIIHKQSLRIGNRNRMEPDILVARDNEYQFVIEVKRPGNTQAKEEIPQLEMQFTPAATFPEPVWQRDTVCVAKELKKQTSRWKLPKL